jgi:hypothetical protein
MITDCWNGLFELNYLPAIKEYSGFKRRQYQIGDHIIVVLNTISDGCDFFLAALEHLSVPVNEDSADLTIYIWQQGEIKPQSLKPTSISIGRTHEKYKFHADQGIVATYNYTSNQAYVMTIPSSPLAYWHIASPFRRILKLYFESRNMYVLHGAAININGRGILIVGKSGAGKSTLAMHCAAHGLGYLGDDYVAVDSNHVVYSLFSSLKVFPNDDCFSEQAHFRISNCRGKRIYFLSQHVSMKTKQSVPICAIVIPDITSGKLAGLEEIKNPDIEGALSPYSLTQSNFLSLETISALNKLKDIPTYLLHSKMKSAEMPKILSSFFKRT